MAVSLNDVTNRWEFENVLTDSVGGLTLTANGATFETGSPMFGVASGNLDGVNDFYSQASANLNPQSGNFSVEIWFDTVVLETAFVISKGAGSSFREGWSIIPTATIVELIINASNDSSQRSVLDSVASLSAGKNQVILVIDRDNNKLKGYLNGTNFGVENNISGFGSIDTSTNFLIGERDTGGLNFGGLVDKVRVYKGYAITDADATTLYNSGNGFDFVNNDTHTGTATAVDGGDRTIDVSMPYTDDDNNDSTYTVDYKLSSDSIWTNWVTGASNTPTPFTTTITGLNNAGIYDVRCTYIDSDGVTGTNPQTISSIALEGIPEGIVPKVVKGDTVLKVVKDDGVVKVVKRVAIPKVIKP